jgi:hypothetical protein
MQGLDALANGTTPVFEAAPAKRKQKPRAEREGGASDALKEWRLYKPDVRIWRNNVGFYKDAGRAIRYGLCNGSADFIGLHSVIVTPGMVGKRVAVFLAIESKAPNKDADAHQATWLDEVRDAGAIAGVARNAEEAEALLNRWREL